MNTITAKNAAKQDFMPLMRELVRAYQAFALFDAQLHRLAGSGLTVSQADVIFTLGNTPGMSCGEIGERTLITKGTLTGVLDRLVQKGLIKRSKDPRDGRSTRISLTANGQGVFEREFPRQVAAIKQRFDRLSPAQRKRGLALLREIRSAFE
jgi:DNA-binding MarR family transcriptional regulator